MHMSKKFAQFLAITVNMLVKIQKFFPSKKRGYALLCLVRNHKGLCHVLAVNTILVYVT